MDPDDDCEPDDTIELPDGVALSEELSEELTERLVEDDFEVDGDTEDEATTRQFCSLLHDTYHAYAGLTDNQT